MPSRKQQLLNLKPGESIEATIDNIQTWNSEAAKIGKGKYYRTTTKQPDGTKKYYITRK